MNSPCKPFKKILIANRGEIAVRVIRAAKELGLETVAVYSDIDAGSLHTRIADTKIHLGQSTAKNSYLNIEKIIAAAIQSGADAIHPGYGFFSENADFANAVREQNLVFIGPTPEVIKLMGDKDRARKKAIEIGVPVVPGTDVNLRIEELEKFANNVGYPVLIKATAGGSGRGMRLVEREEDFQRLKGEAEAEAEAAFANKSIIVEKYVTKPRHIEIQVFADSFGNVRHLGERDCSVQRRHQKIVEESPAYKLHPKVKERMFEAAINLTKSVNYLGAGTLEFLVEGGEEEKSNFYFLEMNTRIQVEHTVTEEVTGIDLVKLQLKVAAGEKIPFSQKEIKFSGHALQFRIYGENPATGFSPATGKIIYKSPTSGIGVREDTWVENGSKISAFYDALLAKLIIKGATREEAISRAKAVLNEYIIEGFPTTLDFHRWLLQQEDYSNGCIDVKWIERVYKGETIKSTVTGPLVLHADPQFT
ncbi:MAG: acetyl-CoA carboxylase biotin carboxylase subunit [Proteobacteria bacterium]|nr:acetyl-CoA carboxylase biotin carboxylase subunit [Pseudomonadota bacterium]